MNSRVVQVPPCSCNGQPVHERRPSDESSTKFASPIDAPLNRSGAKTGVVVGCGLMSVGNEAACETPPQVSLSSCMYMTFSCSYVQSSAVNREHVPVVQQRCCAVLVLVVEHSKMSKFVTTTAHATMLSLLVSV